MNELIEYYQKQQYVNKNYEQILALNDLDHTLL